MSALIVRIRNRRLSGWELALRRLIPIALPTAIVAYGMVSMPR